MSQKRSEFTAMIVSNSLILWAVWYLYSGHQAAWKDYHQGLADYRKLQETSLKAPIHLDDKISVLSIGKTNPANIYSAKYTFTVNNTTYEGSVAADNEIKLYTMLSDSVCYLPGKPEIFALNPADGLKRQERDEPWNWRLYLCFLLCGLSGLILLGYFGGQKMRDNHSAEF